MACARWIIAGAVWAAICSPGWAQAQLDDPAARREFDALFQRLLVQPSDPALNRRFVEVSLRLKDYEAAIGALDRLLFYTPEDAALNFEIGTAYFELGSYVIARSYFEAAAKFSGADQELREQAEAGVQSTVERTRPSPWRVFVQSGLRYQTNANVAPNDIDENENAGDEPTPDFNSFILSTISYVRPFGDRATLEAALSSYYADQFEVDRLDLGLVDLIAGPRIDVVSGDEAELSIKPYAVAGLTTLADEIYRTAVGAGISARAEFASVLTLEPYFEYRDREYFDSDDYPNASDQTGDLATAAVSSNVDLASKAALSTRGGFSRNDAVTERESYDEFFAEATLRLRFDPLGEEGGGDWTFAPFGAFSLTKYDAPEDEASTDPDREDEQWRGGARLDVPLGERFGIGTTIQYTVNDSNDSRFDYENLQISSGPTLRF